MEQQDWEDTPCNQCNCQITNIMIAPDGERVLHCEDHDHCQHTGTYKENVRIRYLARLAPLCHPVLPSPNGQYCPLCHLPLEQDEDETVCRSVFKARRDPGLEMLCHYTAAHPIQSLDLNEVFETKIALYREQIALLERQKQNMQGQ
ncbi:hypothetical protein [Photobacterium sp. R1]